MVTMNPALAQALGDFGNQIASLQAAVDRLSRNQKFNSLPYSSIDNGQLIVTDSTGVIRQVIGIQADGTATTVDVNGPQPGPLDAPTVTPVIQGLSITWDGEFAGSAVYPSDYMMTQIHVSLDPGFTPSAATLQGVLHSAGTYTVLNLTPGSTYYVVLAALSTSGVLGELSGYTSGVPLNNSPYITPGSITTTDIARGAVTTPILAANSVTADNMAANSVTAGTVAAGAIDGMTITGNVIDGALINAGTLTFSDSAGGGVFGYTGGVLTVALAGAPGVDGSGYSYPAGFSMGEPGVPQVLLSQNANGAYVSLPTNDPAEAVASQINAEIINAGLTNEQLMLFLASPANSDSTDGNQWNISMSSDSSDSSIAAQFLITDGYGVPYLSLTNALSNGQAPQFAIGYAGDASFPVEMFLNGAMLLYGTSSGGTIVQKYTTAGTFSWVCPTGVTSIRIDAWGGSGGGGGGAAPTTSGNGGCGGGSGEWAAEYTLAVTAGHTYTITVAAAGSSGAAGTPTGAPGGTGGNGGNTTFPGDSVTVTAHGGQGGVGGHNGHVGGSGGTGSTNTHHASGGTGGASGADGTATGGASGGSSPSTSGTAGRTGGASTGRGPAAGATSVGTGSNAGASGGWGSNSDNGSAGGNGGTAAGGGGGGGGTDAHTWGGGRGGAGAVWITYTQPGVNQILASFSNAAGTDSSSNAYPAGFMGNIVAVQPGTSPSNPEVWHYVGGTNSLGTSFASGWSNYGHSFAPLAFRLLPSGNVEIRGMLAPGSASSNVFTLPVGYRPATLQQIMYGIAALGTATAAPQEQPAFNIATSGVVTQTNVGTPNTNAIWIAGEFSLTI